MWHSSPTLLSLLDVLYRFGQLKCTNPRDRIYGFLGIVPSVVSMGIVPNYKKHDRQSVLTLCSEGDTSNRVAVHPALHSGVARRQHDGEDPQAYSILDRSPYCDVDALVVDSPDRELRRARPDFQRDGTESPTCKVPFFQDHKTGELKDMSPWVGQPPRPVEKYHAQQRTLPV